MTSEYGGLCGPRIMGNTIESAKRVNASWPFFDNV
jgi:hypothetical protein